MRKPGEVVARIRRRPHRAPNNRSSGSNGSRCRASRRLSYLTLEQPGAAGGGNIVCGLLKRRLRFTHRSAQIGGAPINYTATAATYIIKADDGTLRAAFFFVAYTQRQRA